MLARLAWLLLMRRRYPGTARRLALIRRLRRMDPRGFAAWSRRATETHVRWAVRRVPWWRARARSFDRLEDLPVLRRRDLQTHEEALLDPALPRASLARETSGGSTGTPVAVWQDRRFKSWDVATEIHLRESLGVTSWEPRAWVWGADRDLKDLPERELLWMRILKRTVINAFRMGEAELEAAADTLEAQRPGYVQGYATALELLARWLLEHRPAHRIRPRVLRSTAETLRPEARAVIERAFGAPVRDFYGSRECASIAAECAAGSLHVQAHNRVVEIVGDDDRPLDPGRPGRLLVTDLTNRAFGLLRYETGDVATWAEPGPCACGCVYPRIAALHGRTSDFITTPGGERIHGEWFTHLFYGRDDVARFQVYQPSLHRLEVRTVGPARREDLQDVLDAMGQRMGPSVDLVWEAVEAIPATATGKHRFTRSDVPYLPERA